MPQATIHPSSYRDPSGFVFEQDGVLYRQVNQIFASDYDLFMKSGLYQQLIKEGLLVSHSEVNLGMHSNDGYKILQPEKIEFVNYPYEWCFDQLKDAALLTLKILKTGIEHGMILKDATPFNIFYKGYRPVFIDSLSFEKYDESKPWQAYRQFCECFLAPLLISAENGDELIKLTLAFPEGIPLSLCASLLPFKSRFNSLTGLHIHLQSKVAKSAGGNNKEAKFSKVKLLRIIDHLESGISKLNEKNKKTTWSDYYSETIRQDQYLEEKERLFKNIMGEISPTSALDIGCNTGHFSLLAGSMGVDTVSIDNDSRCIDILYQSLKAGKRSNILALWVDICNPSPAIGWVNNERVSFLSRKKFDLIMAFAVIHHLAISANVPFGHIAKAFHALSSSYVLVEFPEPDDEKAKQLLDRKKDRSRAYSAALFEKAFAEYFDTEKKIPFSDGKRCFYLFKRKK